MEEKRRAKRMDIDVTVKLSQIRNTKNLAGLKTEEFGVELTNVSETGIAFRSSEELKLNTFYDIHMEIWGKKRFDTVIEIVRMENNGDEMTMYGCRFIGLKPADRLDIQIHELLEERDGK
ncbi:MAG: PilZ domain-containing protein [Lachnospiraceae bacterium]|nr:PilZ domain-containing protein [Lachnospiraceae bacterium]